MTSIGPGFGAMLLWRKVQPAMQSAYRPGFASISAMTAARTSVPVRPPYFSGKRRESADATASGPQFPAPEL